MLRMDIPYHSMYSIARRISVGPCHSPLTAIETAFKKYSHHLAHDDVTRCDDFKQKLKETGTSGLR